MEENAFLHATQRQPPKPTPQDRKDIPTGNPGTRDTSGPKQGRK